MSEIEEGLSFTWSSGPCAQTLFRTFLMGTAWQDAVSERLAGMKPEILARDQWAIRRIQQAASVQELLGLASHATGLGQSIWYRRMQALDPAVAPLVGDALRHAGEVEDESARSVVYERLIGALAYYGAPGAAAISAAFDTLDDFGKSLACVALGRLGAREHADRLWRYFEHARQEVTTYHFVGALWGLVDLEDSRAGDALFDLLWNGWVFWEAFAMAHLVGDVRLVLPLMAIFVEGDDEAKDLAFWALVSLAHQLGRAELLQALEPLSSEAEVPWTELEDWAGAFLSVSRAEAEDYFGLFSTGMAPEAVEAMTSADSSPLPDGAQVRPAKEPGRNDPCWCGSGVKYKYCHGASDKPRRG
jgi:hypothetical protein